MLKISKATKVITGACLVGLIASCLACLSEDETPQGNEGSTGNEGNGSPSPGTGQPPTGGGQSTPNPSTSQAPRSGLWGTTSGSYLYIWPDGNFVAMTPKVADDGSFDEALSLDFYRKELRGHLTIVPDPKSTSGDLTVTMSYASGDVESGSIFYGRNVSRVDWMLSCRTWTLGLGSWNREHFSVIRPIDPVALSGAFVRSWDRTTLGSPGSGEYGVDITASGHTIFDFKPGNRIYFKNQSDVVTNYTIGTGGGGTVGVGHAGTDFGKTNVEGQGSYTIDGYMMKVTFDNGDVLEDIIHLEGDTLLFGSAYAKRKL
jgi:hypothetical protein